MSGARRLALAAAAVGALLLPAGAGAATINVSLTNDAPAGSFDDVGCTLRDAVQAANTNSNGGSLGCAGDNAGVDTIVLQSGKTYALNTHGVDDTNAAGDLDISGPVTIRSSGPGLARIDAASNTAPGQPVGADRAVHVLGSAGDVTLEGVRVEGGFVGHSAPEFGGGGGILTESLLTLLRSEVVDNRVQGGTYLLGGGVWARGPNARLRILASTIANNVLVKLGNEALGAGIAAYPDVTELTLENSTISGNQAQGSFARAGGIFGGDYLNSPASTLTNVTVTANSADRMGGIWLRGTISGSLIAGNTVTDPEDEPDCFTSGPIVSGGGNVLGNGGEDGLSDCGFTAASDLVGSSAAPITPNLGVLVDNGGPTRTRVPNPGSAAINRGGPCPATDQRGLFRFASAPCDSGAVEVGASLTPPPPPSPPVVVVPPPAAQVTPPTGMRAAALTRCGKLKKATKKQTRKARNRCRAKARGLPL